MKKRILITGGTGFIGRSLINALQNEYDITILTRDTTKHQDTFPKSILGNKLALISNLDETAFEYDIVINLAGHPITCRWRKATKKIIYDSRIETTKALTNIIKQARRKPELFISGSAVGYYGAYLRLSENRSANDKFSDNGLIESDSAPEDNSFSVKLCSDWENQALALEDYGIRVCTLRTGLVLGKGGGIFPKMQSLFRLYLGAIIASGNQYVSWIHVDDVIGAIEFIIETERLRGPVNLTTPNPVNNLEFTTALGDAMFLPVLIKIPAVLLRCALGEMADELLIKGQKVFPKKLLDNGYKFAFQTIDEAFKALINAE